ncbi:MAG: hypothetical protein LC749_01865 [Actinobacteria bacterium]|nr:hypothetical protein [Actinomycetota bacterium]
MAIVITIPAPSHLHDRWGDDGADTIWNNAAVQREGVRAQPHRAQRDSAGLPE